MPKVQFFLDSLQFWHHFHAYPLVNILVWLYTWLNVFNTEKAPENIKGYTKKYIPLDGENVIFSLEITHHPETVTKVAIVKGKGKKEFDSYSFRSEIPVFTIQRSYNFKRERV